MAEENKTVSQEETDEIPVTGGEETEQEAPKEPETAQTEEKAPEDGNKTEETPEAPKETGSDEDTADGKSKTSFFEKKKKDKEKEKLAQQVEELTDRLKRSMAEFDNYRKRTEKEKSSMYIIGARDIVEKILPVMDNFERGMAQAPEEDAFADGMRMIYKQLLTTMDGLGVKPIEAVGKEFNPDLHNAVMHVEDESVGENIVVEELQKGYTYKDFVVRHSMVKVAN